MCCDPDAAVSAVAYVRIINLIQFGQCQEPCEETISPIGIEPCYALSRIDSCTWEGQADTDATCFPLSTLRLELGCDETSTTITLYWFLASGDTAIWRATLEGMPHIHCSQCQTHELNPVQNAEACGTQFSWVHINFGPFGACCEHCPDQYQITISGVAENDPEEFCEDADCQQLNGTYLVDFFQKGTQPTGACTDGLTDWCEYRKDLDLRCTDTRFGFCTLHLYIKTTDNCGTLLRVEITPDDSADDDCETISTTRQGWRGESMEACDSIDVTMDINNVCQDTNWNCSPETIVIHVTVPSDEGRTALTRLTPIGVPGRRYGA